VTKVYISYLLLLFSGSAHAAIGDTLKNINGTIYGIAAGIAVLMMATHALRYKATDNPGEREYAKKGIINVVLAILILSIASSLVSTLFAKPPEPVAPPTTKLVSTTHGSTTSRHTTTTLKKTTTSSTTTTTIPYLTAKNLVDCINKAGGMLFSLPDQCPHCLLQKVNVFEGEKDNIVGPGATYYQKLKFGQVGMICPCAGSAIPCWTNGIGGKNEAGCKTFKQLNAYYGCSLIPYPGHGYKCCDGSINC
jgi:hypothetical protein